jgi:hypothetical protein
MADDLRGTGMNGTVNQLEYKKRLMQVFALMALEKVVSRHGRISNTEQHQRGLNYYVNAINTWKENGGVLTLAGKTVDWLSGKLNVCMLAATDELTPTNDLLGCRVFSIPA